MIKNLNIIKIFCIFLIIFIFYVIRDKIGNKKENKYKSREEKEIELEGYSFENFTNPDNNEIVQIDLTQGWTSSDDFRKNYCTKGGIIDKAFMQGSDLVPLIYGYRPEIYDISNNKLNDNFKNAMTFANIDMNSINPTNGCAINKYKEITSQNMGSIVQLCDPKCKFTFKKKNL